jgi:hypothetical protein
VILNLMSISSTINLQRVLLGTRLGTSLLGAL